VAAVGQRLAQRGAWRRIVRDEHGCRQPARAPSPAFSRWDNFLLRASTDAQ